MAGSGSYDGVFATELEKYDPLRASVAANVEKQRQLLGVISVNQAAYREAFGFREWRAACEVRTLRSLKMPH